MWNIIWTKKKGNIMKYTAFCGGKKTEIEQHVFMKAASVV
jgi:hypothetical protein